MVAEGDGMARGDTARRGLWLGAGGFTPSAPAVLLLVLNLLDGLFTLSYLQMGVAQEANPVMRAAYELSPVGFMALKLLVVNVGVVVLVLHRDSRVAQWALKAAVGVYAVIVTWHLAFLAHLLFP